MSRSQSRRTGAFVSVLSLLFGLLLGAFLWSWRPRSKRGKTSSLQPLFGAGLADIQDDRSPDTPPRGTVEDPYGPGSAAPTEDGTAPDGFDIKGNADSMLFHTIDSPYYARTIAEVWFSSEPAAEEAGFTRWDARRSRRDLRETPPAEVPQGAYGPGSADPLPDGAAPEGFGIKGNIDSMRYHSPESRNYKAVIAEVWFDSEERASAAGFIRWDAPKQP